MTVGEIKLPDVVTLAVPAFVLLVLAEMVVARLRSKGSWRDRYEPRDTLTSLALGLGSTVAGILTGGLFLAFAYWVYQFRLFDFGGNVWGYVWWAFPAAFILDDLAYYWIHRAGHRIRWAWAAHVIHHSSQHYNLSTALRQTWTGFFGLTFLIKLPLFLIGFPPPLVAFVAGINLVYQFWIHTEVIQRMPRWFEAVMNTPSHHRVHHATNPRYLDKNYAGVFIIWDKWFGTFEPELDDEKPRYGIVKNLGSFNVAWAAFHEWVGIAKDVWAAPDWRARLGYAFGEPGWSHDGSRDTSARIKEIWQERRAADAAVQGVEWTKPTSSSSEEDRAAAPPRAA